MLNKLRIDDIVNDEQREIAQILGIESYIKLVEHFGGTSIYILKKDSLIKDIRDNKIRDEFNGCNYVYLAKRYNLTENTIRYIVNKRELDGQIKFEI